jgi:hypothetical protein
MKFSFVHSSGNSKTGPMPVSGTSKDSCPISCPLRNNGCYAATGRINLSWLKLNKSGLTFNELILNIKLIQKGNIWRCNVMGDFPSKNGKINSKQLKSIISANYGKRGFAYTHHEVLGESKENIHNRNLIDFANKNGFTINLSANNLRHADKLADLNIGPVAVVTPINAPKTLFTPKGRKVIQCPATYKEGVTCLSCQLCQKQRSVIVHFPAHGVAKKLVDAIATGK